MSESIDKDPLTTLNLLKSSNISSVNSSSTGDFTSEEDRSDKYGSDRAEKCLIEDENENECSSFSPDFEDETNANDDSIHGSIGEDNMKLEEV